MITKTKNYQWINDTISQLLTKQKRYDVIKEVSKESNSEYMVTEVINSYNETTDLCKHLYNQFSELREAYNSNEIDLQAYKKHLRHFRLLINRQNNYTYPNTYLHSEEINATINQAFEEEVFSVG
jgi:uncharacterized membrane protein YgaE (UPF0421/DUF939 family)